MRVFLSLWLALLLAGACGGALAQDDVFENVSTKEALQSDCFDDDLNDRCNDDSRRQTRARFGVRSIEQLNADGAQVRRVFFVDGYGNEMPTISFIRAPGADPRVTVSVLGEDARGRARVIEMSETLSATVWSEVIDRTQLFHRALAPPTAPVSEDEDEAITICLHSWVTTVEAADPGGAVRVRTQDSCNEGLTSEAGFSLARIAYEALPYCSALDLRHHRNRVTALQACAILRGDRLAAAEVLNRIDAMDDTPQLSAVANTFLDRNITIDWDGEAAAGPNEASAMWDQKYARRTLYLRDVIGESVDRVRVTGVWHESFEDDARHGEVEQIWTRDHGWNFRLAMMRVGRLQR